VSNQQVQKVKVKRLAHVGLWASDVMAQARFYHQVLGFDLRSVAEETDDADEGEAPMFLALGEEQYCLGLFNDTRPQPGNSRKPVRRTLLHHLTFEVDTEAELAALAARLKMNGVDLNLGTRSDGLDLGDTLWLSDPDGNSIEIAVAPDSFLSPAPTTRNRRVPLRPYGLQHIALYTARLEVLVEFYTEALGFDISDWLLRERAWLRCNNNHHTLLFIQGQQGIDHIGYTIASGAELLRWADSLSHQQVPLLWGPGRHGTSNDLFLRISDSEGIHLELSADIQQYYDRDVTVPPRLWHTREAALNLWGVMPSWIHEDTRA